MRREQIVADEWGGLKAPFQNRRHEFLITSRHIVTYLVLR
jgi:hypothetical protein